jgi:hypothetical protein
MKKILEKIWNHMLSVAEHRARYVKAHGYKAWY